MGDNNQNVAAATNVWDFLRAAAVLAAFVGLVVFLVLHYSTEKDAAAMLGVVAPVLAAIVGAGVGYTGGSTVGQAKGQAGKADAVRQGRQALVEHLSQLIDSGGAEDVNTKAAAVDQVKAAIDAVRTEPPVA